MTRKVILFLIAFVLCLVCLSAVSATTRMAENNPVGQSSTGPADRAGATGDIPALGADFEEVTTTETTMVPVTYPTEEPTEEPTVVHTTAPTPEPTTISPVEPTLLPTVMPTTEETELPTMQPTLQPVTGETTSPVPGQLSPVAEFTSSQTSGSGPLTVSFTDRSLNTPTMWYWDFGDGGAD